MTSRGERPDDSAGIEWLDEDVAAAPDEELPQPEVWHPRRRAVVAAGVLAVGVAAVAIVAGTRGSDDERRAGPVIPSRSIASPEASVYTYDPEPPASPIPLPSGARYPGPFDPRTGRARPDVPVARCEGHCERFVYAPPKVVAAVRERFPHATDVFAITIFDATGFVGRTISARSGDTQIRIFVIRTARPSTNQVERLLIRGRTLLRVRVQRSFVQVAASVDRRAGSVSAAKVVALARDERLVSID